MTVKKIKRTGVARRFDRPFGLSMKQAREITGDIGSGNNKLPGYDYAMPASRCITGAKLINEPGSVCHGCYALEGAFLWSHVSACHNKRQDSVTHPEWVNAMATLIDRACLPELDTHWFRWHSSGDIQSPEHLMRIMDVARLTPQVNHWLPTREYGILRKMHFEEWSIPKNLCIRVSAHYVDQPPHEYFGLPISTVHTNKREPVMVSLNRKDSIECRAYVRRNKCGSCRACWSTKVHNVSYPLHGVRATGLRVVA